MNYFKAVESAPRGADSFRFSDFERLPERVRARVLAGIPTGELALARAGDEEARRRVTRAHFWTLVYHLAPARWDALSLAEPVHPRVLDALPARCGRVIEVAAGTGRLTAHLERRAGELVAVEPAAPLRAILRSRLPAVRVRSGEAKRIPLPDAWADLVVACASPGPDRAGLAEMERCTRPAGHIAFISPEEPEWLESAGFRRFRFDPREVAVPPHDPDIEAFFGPLDPPHELLLRSR